MTAFLDEISLVLSLLSRRGPDQIIPSEYEDSYLYLESRIRSALENLSLHEKEVLLLHYWQDLSFAQIGEQFMNLSRERVRQIYEDAMRKMKYPSSLRLLGFRKDVRVVRQPGNRVSPTSGNVIWDVIKEQSDLFDNDGNIVKRFRILRNGIPVNDFGIPLLNGDRIEIISDHTRDRGAIMLFLKRFWMNRFPNTSDSVYSLGIALGLELMFSLVTGAMVLGGLNYFAPELFLFDLPSLNIVVWTLFVAGHLADFIPIGLDFLPGRESRASPKDLLANFGFAGIVGLTSFFAGFLTFGFHTLTLPLNLHILIPLVVYGWIHLFVNYLLHLYENNIIYVVKQTDENIEVAMAMLGQDELLNFANDIKELRLIVENADEIARLENLYGQYVNELFPERDSENYMQWLWNMENLLFRIQEKSELNEIHRLTNQWIMNLRGLQRFLVPMEPQNLELIYLSDWLNHFNTDMTKGKGLNVEMAVDHYLPVVQVNGPLLYLTLNHMISTAFQDFESMDPKLPDPMQKVWLDIRANGQGAQIVISYIGKVAEEDSSNFFSKFSRMAIEKFGRFSVRNVPKHGINRVEVVIDLSKDLTGMHSNATPTDLGKMSEKRRAPLLKWVSGLLLLSPMIGILGVTALGIALLGSPWRDSEMFIHWSLDGWHFHIVILLLFVGVLDSLTASLTFLSERKYREGQSKRQIAKSILKSVLFTVPFGISQTLVHQFYHLFSRFLFYSPGHGVIFIQGLISGTIIPLTDRLDKTRVLVSLFNISYESRKAIELMAGNVVDWISALTLVLLGQWVGKKRPQLRRNLTLAGLFIAFLPVIDLFAELKFIANGFNNGSERIILRDWSGFIFFMRESPFLIISAITFAFSLPVIILFLRAYQDRKSWLVDRVSRAAFLVLFAALPAFGWGMTTQLTLQRQGGAWESELERVGNIDRLRIQSSDEYAEAMGLVKRWSLENLFPYDSGSGRKNKIESISSTDPSQLYRMAGYLSLKEFASARESFEKLLKTDPEKFFQFLGAMQWRIFESGGRAERSAELAGEISRVDFEEAFIAYRALLSHFVHGEKLLSAQWKPLRVMAKKMWNHGRTRVGTLAIPNRIKQRVVGIPQVSLHNVSDFSENSLSVLAGEINREWKRAVQGEYTIMLFTRSDSLERSALRQGMERYGVVDLFDHLFPAESWADQTVIGSEIKGGEDVDSEYVYGVVLDKVSNIKNYVIPEISLVIYPHELYFNESWRRNLRIEIRKSLSLAPYNNESHRMDKKLKDQSEEFIYKMQH